MSLSPSDFLIDDENINTIKDSVYAPFIDGEAKGFGYVPRDYKECPQEMFDPPANIPLIPKSEWSARIKEMEETKSRIYDLFDFDALDQNGNGFCWAYSSTSAVMLDRKLRNQPYVRLSAHAVACIIKNFKDEGGWCGLSAKFYRERGCPSVEFWAEQSMSRQYDKPETWENAALHKITEDWVDLTKQVYDQNLTFDQLMSCLLARIPCPVDFDWWGHSVCAMDPVEVEPGSFGIRILNSWSKSWGDRGTGVLRGNKAIPMGALAVRSSTVS